MANVTQYQVMLYGSKDGYLDFRAQVTPYDGETVLGYIRFHDPGMPFPEDEQTGGKIIMHLPSSMLESVLYVLRHEKPINYYFSSGHAFLGTATAEPVGEAD